MHRQIALFAISLWLSVASSLNNDCYTVVTTANGNQWAPYHGHASVTESGSCISWTANIVSEGGSQLLPGLRAYLQAFDGTADHNYCRSFPPSLLKDERPWCYIAGALQSSASQSARWTYCVSLPPCDSCYRSDQLYRGNVSQTAAGQSCLAWNDSRIQDQPGALTNIQSQLLGAENFYDHNFCRNPSGYGDGSPWCYTASAYQSTASLSRWQRCDVAACRPSSSSDASGSTTSASAVVSGFLMRDIDCYKENSAYRGFVNVTASGKPCLFWDDKKILDPAILSAQYLPYGNVLEGIRNELLQAEGNITHNACRNPRYGTLGDAKPWCYVRDAYVSQATGRYEYCNVPACPDMCDLSVGVPNGQMAAKCTGSVTEQCTFKCNSGFVATVAQAECQRNLVWAPPLSTLCVAAVQQCSSLPLYGIIDPLCPRAVGQTCSFSCSFGSPLRDVANVTCTSSGLWDVLVDVLCPPPPVGRFEPAAAATDSSISRSTIIIVVVVCSCVVVIVLAIAAAVVCFRYAAKKWQRDSTTDVHYRNENGINSAVTIGLATPTATPAAIATITAASDLAASYKASFGSLPPPYGECAHHCIGGPGIIQAVPYPAVKAPIGAPVATLSRNPKLDPLPLPPTNANAYDELNDAGAARPPPPYSRSINEYRVPTVPAVPLRAAPPIPPALPAPPAL